jgi:hypothetical protein
VLNLLLKSLFLYSLDVKMSVQFDDMLILLAVVALMFCDFLSCLLIGVVIMFYIKL